MIGRVFNNRYQITERIGIGGMAEVYRAQDRVLGRMVAIKVMLPQYAADSEFTKRFRQEAASAANLSSPYIVNVYDWGQDEGTYYIVMEYVRGSDLKTAIKQRGAINQRKVAEIGAQVCQALSVAHKQDIVHRDIKPQNIMVQPDGNVKVMDFGIAHAKNTVQGQTSAVLGTAHYISPEQAQGKELTNSSDIYSLGIVLYEAATGKLPFDGPDSVSVATKQVQDFPVPPTQVNPSVDPALEAIIMRALEKDPRNRFETVGDMKHALNDFLAGRTPAVATAVAGPTEAMAQEAYRSNSGPVYAAEGTSVMPSYNGGAGMAAGAGAEMAYPAARSMPPEEEKSGKWKIAAIIAAILALLALLGLGAWALTHNSEPDEPEVTTVAIPNLVGKTVDEATRQLSELELEVGSVSEVNNDAVDPGKIISSDPEAGKEVEKGSKVNLTVSVGKEKVVVPDLSGKNAEEIKQILADAKLNGQVKDPEYSDTVEEGLLIRQDPLPGASVDEGSTVSYILSRGTERIAVQDVYARPKPKPAPPCVTKALA
ncbi:MAG: Stk1 family PASTA domain-containing Ser/Thr kinase [Eggerthellaceae bacterium]|nr:Stk1 family PASTA domain-containing Ser/Thr kinase [Eggerthellaceae bacterium]